MEVVITGNTSQFEQAMANAKMSLEHLVACAVQGGEDIDAVIKALSGQGVDGISTRMQAAIIGMEQALNSLGASGDEVEGAKEKIVNALQAYASSSEESTVKMEEMGKVTDEVLSGMSVKSEELQQGAGAAGEALAELAAKSAEMKEGLGELDFKDFSEENVANVTAKLQEYKEVTEQTAEAAVKAYEEQGEVVKSLEEKMEDLNEQMQDPANGEDEIRDLKEEYEKLDEELKEAKECHEDLALAVDVAREKAEEATAGFDSWKKAVDTAGNTDSFFKKVGDGVTNLTDKVKNWATGNGKFSAGLSAFKDSLNQLPIPLGNAADGIMGMVKSMRVMIATPLGAVLAAISAALAAVTSWFSKSTEGQMAFARISGYLGSILNSLTDVFIRLGEYIYKAFFTADGAMRGFAEGLVKTLKSAVKTGVSLVQGLGEALKGLGQIFTGEFSAGWETIKSGAAKVADSFSNAVDTVKNAWDTSIKGFAGVLKMGQDGLNTLNSTDLLGALKKMHNTAIEEGNLALERKKTEQAISGEKEHQARVEGEILEKRKQIEQLSGKEKLKAIAEAKDEQAKKLEERIKLQEKLVEIAKKQDSYHINSLADEEKLRNLNVELLNLKKQQSAATLAMTKLEQSTKRAMARSAASDAKKAAAEEKQQQKMTAAQAAAEEKLAEVIYTQELDRVKQSAEMEEKIAEARIAAMKDGAEKTAAQQAQQNKKELDAIEKQKDAAIEAERKRQKAVYDAEQAMVKAGGGTAGVWDDSMFDRSDAAVAEIVKKYDELARLVAEKQQTIQQDAQSSAMRDYLKEYGTYEQKKLAITEEYEKKIEAAQTEGEKLSLGKKMEEAISDLNLDQLKKEIDWEYVFGDLDNIPIDILDDVNEKLRKFKDTAKELKPDEIKAVVEAMTKIETRLGSTGSIAAARNATQERKTAQENYDMALAFSYAAKGDPQKEAIAYQNLIAKSKELTKAKKKEEDAWDATEQTALNYAKALKEVGDFIGGTIGDVLNLGASAIEAGVGLANGIQMFKNSMDALQRSVAILAIIQAALQAVRLIADLLGDSEDQTLKAYVDAMDGYINLLKDDINDLNKAMGDTKNTMAETIELYKDYVELQKESASAIRSQSQAWLNSGASKGFLGMGSKSSEGVKIVKGIEENMKSGNADVKAYFTEAYNTLMGYARKAGQSSLGRLDWIWNLTDDELRELAKNTKVMSALGNELGDSIRNYIEAIDGVNDSEGMLFENLLSVDFDSFYSDFSDMISDMEVDSENFADNFGEMLRETLIRNMVAESYKEQLENLFNLAGQYAKEGTLEEHIDELKTQYKLLGDSAREQIKTINEITGYKEDLDDENNNKENQNFLNTIRNSFQSLLSGSVDDIDAWAKNIRKAIATSIMEGLLLNGDYDTWAKGWGDAYAELMNEYYTSVIDEEVYHQRLEALKEEFKTKTEEIESQAKDMMKEFEEDIASDVTFKAMTDSWVSALMDMNKTATDWSKDIGRIMAQKIIEQFVSASMIQPLLDNLQNAFNSAMGMKDATIETVLADQGIADALQRITEAYPDIKKVSDKVMSAFGLTETETGQSKVEEAKHALSSLKDTLVGGIMDINKTAADFGKDIGRTLVEQMVSQMVENKYAWRIEGIQKMWDGVLNGTSKNTINSVQREITRLYKAIENETKELTEQLKEVIDTSDPFEGLHSSLLSFLMDAEQDIDTFMADLSRSISSQLIDKYVLDGLDEQMALWSKQMKVIMGSGGSPEQIAKKSKELMDEIAAYSEDRKAEAQLWHELMGTDNTDYGDQQASVNMADKATYDQFELFLGMQTAMMIGQEQGNAVRVQILATLQAMGGITSPNNAFTEQLRNAMMLSNEYLLDIKNSNRVMLDSFGVKLDSINSKLSRL